MIYGFISLGNSNFETLCSSRNLIRLLFFNIPRILPTLNKSEVGLQFGHVCGEFSFGFVLQSLICLERF